MSFLVGVLACSDLSLSSASVFRLSYVNHAEDLASKLLQCSPKNRLSAQAALSHEYFSDLPPRLWELTDSEYDKSAMSNQSTLASVCGVRVERLTCLFMHRHKDACAKVVEQGEAERKSERGRQWGRAVLCLYILWNPAIQLLAYQTQEENGFLFRYLCSAVCSCASLYLIICASVKMI